MWSGTSFAAPLVAGRIAKVLAGPRYCADRQGAGPAYPAATVEAVADVVATLAEEDKSRVIVEPAKD